jgi:hypothetical protein
MTAQERYAWITAEVSAAARAMHDAEKLAHPGRLTEIDCRVLARLALQAVRPITDEQK